MFIFHQKDIDNFSEVSGDWNPIHTSPSVARRLIAGDVVLHGIFVLLHSLNDFCHKNYTTFSLIKCRFLKPIFLNTEVQTNIVSISEYEAKIIVSCNAVDCISIVLKFGGTKNLKVGRPGRYPKSNPKYQSFNYFKNCFGSEDVRVNLNYIKQNFPKLADNIGVIPVQSLMLCSKIVGMDCPGHNSLFSGLDIGLDPETSSRKLIWTVQRHTLPIAPIKMSILGGGLCGHVESFYRPTEVEQDSFKNIRKKVDTNIFKSQKALVIGASRGLGELTAKIIAAGGGDVIGTFYNGYDDSEKIRKEVKKNNKKFDMVSFNVTQTNNEYINDFFKNIFVPTHIYYFASPRIKSNKSEIIDDDLLNIYRQFFVKSFSSIVEVLHELFKEKITVFYPSTVFIDEDVADFKEYVIAKLEGEGLYSDQNYKNNITILYKRLPRLKTDQTAGILSKNMDDNFEIMYKAIKELV